MSCTSMCSCSENCENEDRGNFALDNNIEDDEMFDDFSTIKVKIYWNYRLKPENGKITGR